MTIQEPGRLRQALVGLIIAGTLAALALVAWRSQVAIESVRAEPVPTLSHE